MSQTIEQIIEDANELAKTLGVSSDYVGTMDDLDDLIRECDEEISRMVMEEHKSAKKLLGGLGYLMDGEFVGGNKFYNFTCSNGHSFPARCDDIHDGFRCTKCQSDSLKNKFISIAASRRGILISDTVKKSSVLDFRCRYGHYFKTSQESIVGGGWCPECAASKYKSEGICRDIAELADGVEYSKDRPEFMRPKGLRSDRCMELDMYSPVKKLAIEYNGEQHYGFTQAFHNSIEDYEYQVQRDTERRRLCALAGVILLEVPYVNKSSIENLEKRMADVSKEKCFPSMINPEFVEMMNEVR